jgi:hypothetical protein
MRYNLLKSHNVYIISCSVITSEYIEILIDELLISFAGGSGNLSFSSICLRVVDLL